MKYRVINQSVEIHGIVRRPGEVVDESELAPSSGARLDDGTVALSEAESLLLTQHIEQVPE